MGYREVFDNGNPSCLPPSCQLFYILANHSTSYFSIWPRDGADSFEGKFACFEDEKIGQFPRLLSKNDKKKGRVIYTLNESSKSLQTIPPCIFYFFFLALTRIQSPLFSAVALVRPPFLTHFLLPSYRQSSKKSASADVDEGPALLKYNGKDARFKDEKDLKVGLLEIPPWT